MPDNREAEEGEFEEGFAAARAADEAAWASLTRTERAWIERVGTETVGYDEAQVRQLMRGWSRPETRKPPAD